MRGGGKKGESCSHLSCCKSTPSKCFLMGTKSSFLRWSPSPQEMSNAQAFIAGVFGAAAGTLHSLGSVPEDQVGQLGNVSRLFSA